MISTISLRNIKYENQFNWFYLNRYCFFSDRTNDFLKREPTKLSIYINKIQEICK